MANERSPIGWAILPIYRYRQFSGRSTRAEFWWFTGASLALGYALDLVDRAMGSELGLLGLIYTFGILLPSITVSVRRLHDTDRSGWWYLAVFAPAAWMGFQSSFTALDGPTNELDMTSAEWSAFGALIIGCVILTIFMILPGTKVSNSYGPDPHEDHEVPKPVLT